MLAIVFISERLANSLALRVTPTIPYSVTLGDGSRVRVAGLSRDVALSLASEVFTISCYVFPLRNIDVILGVSWLASLGDVTANWNDLSMKFSVQERQVALRGDPSLTRRTCSACDIMLLRRPMLAGFYSRWSVTLQQTSLSSAMPYPRQNYISCVF